VVDNDAPSDVETIRADVGILKASVGEIKGDIRKLVTAMFSICVISAGAAVGLYKFLSDDIDRLTDKTDSRLLNIDNNIAAYHSLQKTFKCP